MNIVIDTSVIGLAQLYETARTGIYRTISCLSQELLAGTSHCLRYTSLSSHEINRLTDLYFQKRLGSAAAFPRNRGEKMMLALAAGGAGSPAARLKNKILSRLYRLSLTRSIGRNADIFHSMYAPLPRFGGKATPLRLLTVYDIIPLLHPEYFADGFADEFRPIVDSFDPERDFVITISEWTKNDICAYFKMAEERVFVTPLAASPALYYRETEGEKIARARRKYHIPAGSYFLTLATVEKRKNLITSLRSFKRLLRETRADDLFFVLVGTMGWKVGELLDLIETDELLKGRVVRTGYIPDDDLSAVYSGALAFVYPSLYEGFGLPPLEAMQCGVPVITSDTTSLPEVVGDAGLLVAPEDEEALAESMHALLVDAALREEYGQKGLARAARFSWSRCAEMTIAAYETAWQMR